MQHVILLIDNSYSMCIRQEQMINGLNKFVENLKKKNNILFTLIFFCHTRTYICKGVPIKDVKTFDKTHLPRYGYTHLYDSIASILTEWIPEKEMYHNLFIITDGEDNGSFTINKQGAIDFCNIAVEQYGWVITHCDTDFSKLVSENIDNLQYNVGDLEEMFGNLNV